MPTDLQRDMNAPERFLVAHPFNPVYLLPLVELRGNADDVTRLRVLLATRKRNGLYGNPPAYYDQCLALFGEGYVERRYTFSAEGRLEVKWESRCE